MVTRSQILQALPPYAGRVEVLEQNQGVRDIMQGMRQWHKKFASDYDKIAPLFIGHSPAATAKNVFNFLKGNTRYVIEGLEVQTVRGPAAIVATGDKIGIDCKNYALFIGGVLDAVNRSGAQRIPFVYRYASYDLLNEEPGHVFIVAYPNTENEIWIDPVLQRFNQRDPAPFHHIDKNFSNMALQGISGTPAQVAGGVATFFAGNQRKQQLAELLPKIAPYCIYLYIDWPGSAKKPAIGRRTIPSNPNMIGRAVTDKIEMLYATLWDFGQQTGSNLDTEVFGPLRGYVTEYLGTDPANWWQQVFQGQSFERIGFLSSVLAADAAGAVSNFNLSAVKNILAPLFKGLTLKHPVESWTPQAQDWAGLQTTPFAFRPLAQTGGSNGPTAEGSQTTAAGGGLTLPLLLGAGLFLLR